MKFYDVRLIVRPRSGIVVQWKVEPEYDDMGEIEIEIQRSESSSGPFSVLTVVDPMSPPIFLDETVGWFKKSKNIGYKLIGRLKTTGEVMGVSNYSGLDGELPLDAREALWQKTVLLEGVNGHTPFKGIDAVVYKKRGFGRLCPTCTDPVTHRRIISQCRECGGTGFSGNGYYDPIKVRINFQPTPVSNELTTFGRQENKETDIEATNYPIYYPNDLIYEPGRALWRVRAVDVVERNRITLFQYIRVRELDRNDIEYQIINQQTDH